MSSVDFCKPDEGRWAASLEDEDLPVQPGAYCWWEGEDLLYVGATEDLRRQLLYRELRRDEGSVPRLRKIVVRRLKARGPVPSRGRERMELVDAFLDDCQLGWTEVRSVDEAEQLAAEAEARLRRGAWAPRTPEDELLQGYLQRLGTPGRVHTEVPVRSHADGQLRRIDAVRLPDLPPSVTRYDRDAFFPAVGGASTLELIEVKGTLNRTVIGQLMAGRDMVVDAWKDRLGLGAELGVEVRLTAVVARGDPALEPICARNGIRVVTLETAAPEEIDDVADDE